MIDTPPIQRQCQCLTYCVEKCKLAPDEYCRKDREAAGLAQEPPPPTSEGDQT
jgi:hypothetical protein